MSNSSILNRVSEAIADFRSGQTRLSDLQNEFEAASSALEGDVPKDLRVKLHNGAEELEYIQFMVKEANEEAAVAKVLDDLEVAVRQFISST